VSDLFHFAVDLARTQARFTQPHPADRLWALITAEANEIRQLKEQIAAKERRMQQLNDQMKALGPSGIA